MAERRLAERLKRRRQRTDAAEQDAQPHEDFDVDPLGEDPADDEFFDDPLLDNPPPTVDEPAPPPSSPQPTVGVSYGYGDWTVAVDPDRVVSPGRKRAGKPTRPRGAPVRANLTAPRPAPSAGPRKAAPLSSRLDAVREAELVHRPRPRTPRDGPVIAPGEVSAPVAAPEPPTTPATERPRRPVQPPRAATPPKPERERRPRKASGSRKAAPGEIAGGGTVVIDGELFPLTDWSPEAIGIPSPRQFYKIGDRRLLELELDFTDYAVNVDLIGVVAERADGRTEWRIDRSTKRQRQLLMSLSAAAARGKDAFQAGADGAGSARRRDRHVRSARAKRWMPWAGLASLPLNAVIIALIVIVGALTDPNAPRPTQAPVLVTLPVEPLHAAVAVPFKRLESPASGALLRVSAATGELVARGSTMLQMRSYEEDRERIRVLSPCECVVARMLTRVGRPLREGQLIATLHDRDATAVVHALYPAGDAPPLGTAVSVRPSGVPTPVNAKITSTAPTADGFVGLTASLRALNPDTVLVELTPDRPLPVNLAGVPVFVEPAGQ